MKHLLVPLKAIYDIVLNQNQSPWFNHDLSLKLMLYFLSFLLNAKKNPKTKGTNRNETINKKKKQKKLKQKQINKKSNTCSIDITNSIRKTNISCISSISH